MALSSAEREELINNMRHFPAELRALVADLSAEDLHTAYQSGEWTVAQNVHHLADAHINAFMRVKLGLTEDNPAIKGYDHNLWAETPDARDIPIESSLRLLEGLHERWCVLWDSLSEDDWLRPVTLPTAGERPIEHFLRIYANHGPAHIQQIRETLAAKGS
jgi:uncharacterized damage-inducible protein DinB